MNLRWYQAEAVDAAYRYLANEIGSPVIVAPTGAGKSVIIAEAARKAVQQFGKRVLVLAHRKELLVQNAEKLQSLLPDIDIGIYSAGLGKRHTDHQVVCCGIQSVYDKSEIFGERSLCLIDEVHLVPSSGDGMYRTFTQDLERYNNALRFIGLTATPFRTGEGSLCKRDGLFQKICYDIPIKRLIDEGFLCPVMNKPAEHEADTSGLHIRAGEFIESENAALFSADDIVEASCREIVEKTRDRKSVLIFCCTVSHAESVQELIQEYSGQECGIVTGESGTLDRAATLQAFKRQNLKYLCNVDVLTTGFDAPCVDAIAILRATASPGLFAQICGRGFRVHSSKPDCLILDFGQNISRHGPIDDPEFGRRSKQARGSDRKPSAGNAPEKECPVCKNSIAANAMICPECGWKFPPRHEDRSDEENALLSEAAKPKRWLVEGVSMARHSGKEGKQDTLKVSYELRDPDVSGNLGYGHVSEWVCIEHDGFARRNAVKWWRDRSRAPMPNTIDEALSLWNRGAVASPFALTTRKDGKWDRIMSCEIDPEEIPESWREAEQIPEYQPSENEVLDAPF